MEDTQDSPLMKLLYARGFHPFCSKKTRELLIPPHIDSKSFDKLYTEMGRYSFRLLLRDIIKSQKSFTAEDLTRFSSIERVREDIDFLLGIDLIEKKDRNSYKLALKPVRSFGETLEWFVAETIRREFSGEALSGIKFKGSEHGGDYDVVAVMGNTLAYIEAKSSPPKHIMQSEVRAFFDRISDLLPDFAVLLMDTELRMKDKLVPMFEEELTRRYGEGAEQEYPVERLLNELFHIKHRVFIMNTKRSLAENLRLCYRAYLRSKML